MTTVELFGKESPVAILAMILIVAGAGAAAGASMAGSMGGEITTAVDQAIVVNTSADQNIEKDCFINVNDDGTEFRSAAQIFQGDSYALDMNFTYNGQTDINAEMILDIPEGLNVDVEPTIDDPDKSNVSVGQVDEDTWLLNIDDEGEFAGEADDFQLSFQISTESEVEPGFYTIEGQLYPVDV